MSLDRRIYLATALAALVAGTAVVAASPQDPFRDAGTIHTVDGVVSIPASAIVLPASDDTDRVYESNNVTRQGLVIVDGSDGGVGVRAPAAWPVDLRREMAPSGRVVGLLR